MDLDFVRPPMLEMKKVDETDDYKEYEVTTFKTPKDRNSTNKEDEVIYLQVLQIL